MNQRTKIILGILVVVAVIITVGAWKFTSPYLGCKGLFKSQEERRQCYKEKILEECSNLKGVCDSDGDCVCTGSGLSPLIGPHSKIYAKCVSEKNKKVPDKFDLGEQITHDNCGGRRGQIVGVCINRTCTFHLFRGSLFIESIECGPKPTVWIRNSGRHNVSNASIYIEDKKCGEEDVAADDFQGFNCSVAAQDGDRVKVTWKGTPIDTVEANCFSTI